MDNDTKTKHYQMIIHNLNGLKNIDSPSFNAEILTKHANELVNKNNYLNEEYKNKYIQSIYENNEIYDLFKSSSFSSEIELEEKINEKIREKNSKLSDIDDELLKDKSEAINKYKEKENIHISKIHFINTNKKENKDFYMKEVGLINTKRVHSKQKYDEDANDISSKNEQKQYKYNHSIDSSIEKNKKDKQKFEHYLQEKIEFLESRLDSEIEKAKKEIVDNELIIADKTILFNNSITRLSEDYKKRLQYAYIPYDIEQNKLLDQDQDEQKLYGIIEEQILNEFKTKLQENDVEIEKLRKKHNDAVSEYKNSIRKIKKEQNLILKKAITEINQEIAQTKKVYTSTKNKEYRCTIKKLIKQKQNLSTESFKKTTKLIEKIKDEHLVTELEYIEKIEKLRTEKIKYETSKSNAMKNLNHERTFFQVKNSQKIKQILEEKDSFTATDKYDENIEILKLRLDRDIEKANINKNISLINLNINSKKYQHKYLINKAIVEKEYNEGLSNADLMYQRESNVIRKNFSNVSSMLEIQRNAIINNYETKIFAEQMAIEQEKNDYYTSCDNIQYQIFRKKYDYETKVIDNEINYKTKIADIKKQYLSTTNVLLLRQLKIDDAYKLNCARVKLYQSRFEVEKNMINDAYLTFYDNMHNLIEFENYIHSNFNLLEEKVFNNNKKNILITLEYIKQLKLITLEEYYEHELTIINSRINFENDLKFKKIIENLKNEKKNLDNQINIRKDKLIETISSYLKTIKLFEENIENKKSQNIVLRENIKESSIFERKEIKNLIKNNNNEIKNHKKQIKVNNDNIKELGNTNSKIEIELQRNNRDYNKRIKTITKTLQNEAAVYTNIINLIRSQYYRLKSFINRSSIYTARNKYTHESGIKLANKVIGLNSKLLLIAKNYYEIHYLKFTSSISNEYSILQESYDKNYLQYKKSIEKELNSEKNIYNTKLKSISNVNRTNLEVLQKTYINNKKELTMQLDFTSKTWLEKIKDSYNLIEQINNKLELELKCHDENFDAYEAHYKNSLKELNDNYSKIVEQITKNYHNNILKLENDKKHHDKNVAVQNISLETIRKNSISDLNNEFQASVNKINNKVLLIKNADKESKNKYEKQKKILLKKFVTEQLEIRTEYNKQEKEIDAKCLKRIKTNKKDFIKKFNMQK